NGSDHYGLEINNYEDFHIRGNTLQNIKEFAMNIYTAGGDRIAGSFAWGDNFTIEKNTINNVGRALRFAHTVWPNGYRNTPKNLIIQDNTISRVNERNTSVAAIAVSGGAFNGLKVA